MLSINQNYFDYFFTKSKLSGCNQVDAESKKLLERQLNNIQIIELMSNNILNPIEQVLSTEQCDILFAQVLFPLYVQRFDMVYNYMILTDYSAQNENDVYDLQIIAFPLVKMFSALSQMLQMCSVKSA